MIWFWRWARRGWRHDFYRVFFSSDTNGDRVFVECDEEYDDGADQEPDVLEKENQALAISTVAMKLRKLKIEIKDGNVFYNVLHNVFCPGKAALSIKE